MNRPTRVEMLCKLPPFANQFGGDNQFKQGFSDNLRRTVKKKSRKSIVMELDFAFPIETAGKRGYRVQSARNLDQAARFDLADSAWSVLSGVRLALLTVGDSKMPPSRVFKLRTAAWLATTES